MTAMTGMIEMTEMMLIEPNWCAFLSTMFSKLMLMMWNFFVLHLESTDAKAIHGQRFLISRLDSTFEESNQLHRLKANQTNET